MLQPSPLRGSGCNTLLPLGLANVNARKRMFYPLIIFTWWPCCQSQEQQQKRQTRLIIRKTCPCNKYPLIPHFYIVKLGYAGVYLFLLFLLKNIEKYLSFFFSTKNFRFFYNFKIICILHSSVFVMFSF